MQEGTTQTVMAHTLGYITFPFVERRNRGKLFLNTEKAKVLKQGIKFTKTSSMTYQEPNRQGVAYETCHSLHFYLPSRRT